MKVSIVIAILNSHEVVRRQLLFYHKQRFPSDVEVVYVDDGSVPPLDFTDRSFNFKFTLIQTNDHRRWTQPAARNMGAKVATGDYLILTDIDHIVDRKLVEVARNPFADVIRLKREAAIIDEKGNFVQDREVLKSYGLLHKYRGQSWRLPPHGNSYIIRRELYLSLGGVSEKLVGTGFYPNREEQPLKRKINKLAEAGKITLEKGDKRPTIYMFPNGRFCGDKDYNPFGLFHNLSRQQYWTTEEYKAAKRAKGETPFSNYNGKTGTVLREDH